MSWRELGVENLQRDESLNASLRRFIASSSSTVLNHDPDWLEIQARGTDHKVRLFVCSDGEGGIAAYAPLLEHPTRVNFTVLDRSLWSHAIRRLVLTRGMLVDETWISSAQAFDTFLAFVRGSLGPRKALFFLGGDYDDGSVLRRSSFGPDYLVLPFGPVYRRRLVDLPESLDSYLKTLGSNTRQDLRRQERRLLKQCADAVSCEVYVSTDDAERFLAIAAKLSSATYQHRLLDLGIRNDHATRMRLRALAEKGWFRGYILRCNDAPAAFMLGYLHEGTYYSADIGYDAKWAEWSVGNVLHLAVIRDLIALAPRPARFDFMYGDSANKERLSNSFRTERNLYLFPRSGRWVVLVGVLTVLNRLSESAGTGLERLGIKPRIRRFLRRRSTG